MIYCKGIFQPINKNHRCGKHAHFYSRRSFHMEVSISLAYLSRIARLYRTSDG